MFRLLVTLRIDVCQFNELILLEHLNEKPNLGFDHSHPVHVLFFYGCTRNKYDEMS